MQKTKNVITNAKNAKSCDNFDQWTIDENPITELRYEHDTVFLPNIDKELQQLILSVKRYSEDQNHFTKMSLK